MRSGLLSKQIKQAIISQAARCHLNGILPVGPYWPKNVCWLGIDFTCFFFLIFENIQKQRSDSVIFLHLHAINCFNTLEVRAPSK